MRVFNDVEEIPIALEEAKQLRLELMEEKKGFTKAHGAHFEVIVFHFVNIDLAGCG